MMTTDLAGGSSALGSGPVALPLTDLLARAHADARVVAGDPAVRIARISCDSRSVRADTLFVAVDGTSDSGLHYVADAQQRGAVAVATSEEGARDLVAKGTDLTVVAARETRPFIGDVAAELAGRPSEHLVVVAVTGTSGKTTTTYLLEAIWRAAGVNPGVIGTVEVRFADRHRPAQLTTPDAIELQELLREMREAGVTHVVLEASSHALALERLRGLCCDVGVFTNFGRDHLDFHHTSAEYLAAKARLFREVLPASGKRSRAVLNAADPVVSEMGRSLSMPVLTFGEGGQVRAEELTRDMHGTRGVLVLGDRRVPFATELVGEPHLQNVLAAAATAHALGIEPEAIVAGIAACRLVPGRLQSVEHGQPFAVVVDYAHKPDALERTLASLRTLARGRLIVVFGCGGDRDAGKRPLMGAIAARGADVTVLTSDNPRTEDPMAILAAIESGVRETSCTRVAPEALGQARGGGVYAVLPERRAAISAAIAAASEGDLVLIAGKGHEDYQIVGRTKFHLDDTEEAEAALAARGYRGSEGRSRSGSPSDVPGDGG